MIAQFTNFLGDNKEISKDTLFIDGTKIESSANRYTFVWKKAINKNMAKMMSNISDFMLKCEINSGKTEFTSKELATICGVSIRTMDRIILKLCDAGYCDVVSEQLMSKYGRPSRILRFKSFLLF